MSEPIQYWRADDHQFASGEGKVHILRESGDKTLCGLTIASTPGRPVAATLHNCMGCNRLLLQHGELQQGGGAWRGELRERGARQSASRERWARREAEWDTKNEEWRRWYRGYLQSPAWAQRRKLVFEREGGWCEGCRMRRATDVHHLTYEHAGNEFLFELMALCDECHKRLTKEAREEREKRRGF